MPAHYWWGSVFLTMVPVAALSMVGAILFIPSDRPDAGSPLDIRGLATAALAVVSLVYAVIEAPDRGWASASTVGGFVASAVAFAALIVVERGPAHPMLDVKLFTNLRFTAASGAVTLAFFALSGFVFLITFVFPDHARLYRFGCRRPRPAGCATSAPPDWHWHG